MTRCPYQYGQRVGSKVVQDPDAAARRLGWCLLYRRAVQLPARDVDDPDAGPRAASAGRIVAGRVPVSLHPA